MRPSLRFFGALTLVLRGERVDEMLPALLKAKIPVRNVKVRNQTCTLTIKLDDFDTVYRVCRAKRVKMRIARRHGLPFLARRLFRRKAFLIGAFLFIWIIAGLSSVVWSVRVNGVDEETAPAVLAAARDTGLFAGALKPTLPNIQSIQSQLLKKLPTLSWVGVQIHGSKAVIEAVERVPGVAPANGGPQNVIAGKPGVVRAVFATRGVVAVHSGQVVHPGQVLISGALAGGASPVPASGRVMAEVFYESNVGVPLHVVQGGLTGNAVVRDYLTFGRTRVRIWGWSEPEYQAGWERDETSEWRVGNFVLPVQLQKVTLYEAIPKDFQKSETQAEQSALQLAKQDVLTQSGNDATILGQTVLHREVANGKLYEKVLTRTEEDIGVPSRLAVPPVAPQIGSVQPAKPQQPTQPSQRQRG